MDSYHYQPIPIRNLSMPLKHQQPAKRMLAYGFGPFGVYSHNITSDIIDDINRLGIANGIVFETQFKRSMIENALQQYAPDIIIGIGLHGRAKKIRIERRARNWQVADGSNGKRIVSKSPEFRYVPIKIQPTEMSTVTYNAGSYVCNYSMYLMCEYCEKTNAKFAFLHVPVNVNPRLASRFIGEIFRSLLADN